MHWSASAFLVRLPEMIDHCASFCSDSKIIDPKYMLFLELMHFQYNTDIKLFTVSERVFKTDISSTADGASGRKWDKTAPL